MPGIGHRIKSKDNRDKRVELLQNYARRVRACVCACMCVFLHVPLSVPACAPARLVRACVCVPACAPVPRVCACVFSNTFSHQQPMLLASTI